MRQHDASGRQIEAWMATTGRVSSKRYSTRGLPKSAARTREATEVRIRRVDHLRDGMQPLFAEACKRVLKRCVCAVGRKSGGVETLPIASRDP